MSASFITAISVFLVAGIAFTSSCTVDGGKYQVYDNRVNWSAAKEQCQEDGYQFAMIKNQEDMDQLRQDISEKLGEPDDIEDRRYWRGDNWVWIGGTDEADEGAWKWTATGEAINTDAEFLEWVGQPGKQPDNKENKEGKRQHYLAISRGDGKLDDKFLERDSFFACQCPDDTATTN